MSEEKLIAAGRAALAEAMRLFELDVIDPSASDLATPAPGSSPAKQLAHERAVHSREVIDEILTSAGWGWEVPYKGNKVGREWCGFFAARCWRVAGINPQWLAAFFAGTLRLYNWGHYRDWNDHKNPKPTTGPRRLAVRIAGSVPGDVQPREGDILIVGDGTPSVGDHITIVKSFRRDLGIFETVSGNGGGSGPDGKNREGVVLRNFGLTGPGYRALWLYRPSSSDLL